MDADDRLVAEATERILACVGDLIASVDGAGIPSRAVIVYEVLTEDGDAAVNYVATSSMVTTDILGFARFLDGAAISALLSPDEE